MKFLVVFVTLIVFASAQVYYSAPAVAEYAWPAVGESYPYYAAGYAGLPVYNAYPYAAYGYGSNKGGDPAKAPAPSLTNNAARV